MKTYTTLRNNIAQFCNVSTADTTKMTVIDGYLNDSIRTICNLQGGKLRFLEDTKDMTTEADQESYQIPVKFRKLIDLYVYSGSGGSSDTIYSPEMVFDPTKWKFIKQARYGSASTPYFTYVENDKFYIQPVPSVSGNKITLRGRINVVDLTIADYTAGTIVSIANAGTTVTGSGTTFTADMVGRYINIPRTTAANGGDGRWYEIGGYTSATVITLLQPYEGTSISAGSATYTIGQVPPIPEAYQPAIVYRSTALYWQNQNDLQRSKTYWMQYDGGNEAGYNKDYGGLISQMLANEGETQEGSYIAPFASTLVTPQAPYYFPQQQASGF
jgi:hypothetical protein